MVYRAISFTETYKLCNMSHQVINPNNTTIVQIVQKMKCKYKNVRLLFSGIPRESNAFFWVSRSRHKNGGQASRVMTVVSRFIAILVRRTIILSGQMLILRNMKGAGEVLHPIFYDEGK